MATIQLNAEGDNAVRILNIEGSEYEKFQRDYFKYSEEGSIQSGEYQGVELGMKHLPTHCLKQLGGLQNQPCENCISDANRQKFVIQFADVGMIL